MSSLSLVNIHMVISMRKPLIKEVTRIMGGHAPYCQLFTIELHSSSNGSPVMRPLRVPTHSLFSCQAKRYDHQVELDSAPSKEHLTIKHCRAKKRQNVALAPSVVVQRNVLGRKDGPVSSSSIIHHRHSNLAETLAQLCDVSVPGGV